MHAERLISHRFPVEEAAEAYRLADNHPDLVTAVIIIY
jgi:threonine dehydrogenase-like Zn-dependent dehydrogenase